MPNTEALAKIDNLDRLVQGMVTQLNRIEVEISVLKVVAGNAEAASRKAVEEVSEHGEVLFKRNGSAVMVRLGVLETHIKNAHLRIDNLKGETEEHHRVLDLQAQTLGTQAHQVNEIRESKKENKVQTVAILSLILSFISVVAAIWIGILALKH